MAVPHRHFHHTHLLEGDTDDLHQTSATHKCKGEADEAMNDKRRRRSIEGGGGGGGRGVVPDRVPYDRTSSLEPDPTFKPQERAYRLDGTGGWVPGYKRAQP